MRENMCSILKPTQKAEGLKEHLILEKIYSEKLDRWLF